MKNLSFFYGLFRVIFTQRHSTLHCTSTVDVGIIHRDISDHDGAGLTNPETNNDVVMLLIIYETHCRYLEVKMADCS